MLARDATLLRPFPCPVFDVREDTGMNIRRRARDIIGSRPIAIPHTLATRALLAAFADIRIGDAKCPSYAPWAFLSRRDTLARAFYNISSSRVHARRGTQRIRRALIQGVSLCLRLTSQGRAALSESKEIADTESGGPLFRAYFQVTVIFALNLDLTSLITSMSGFSQLYMSNGASHMCNFIVIINVGEFTMNTQNEKEIKQLKRYTINTVCCKF